MKRETVLMSERNDRANLSRRQVLKGAVVGAGVVASSGIFGFGSEINSAHAVGKPVSYSAYFYEPALHMADKAMLAAAAKAGFDLAIDSIDHFAFQNQIVSYLQGTPDDVVDFTPGYRMQFAASKGLLTDVSDVWSKIRRNYSRSYVTSSTASDKKQYLIPVAKYPWAVMYRKSIFKAAGIDPSSIINWADFLNACTIFKSKGLTPIALGDAGGWEAMGLFDFINLRTNGLKFHSDLLSGRVAWTDDRVQKSFRNWETLLPFQNSNALDLDWAGAGHLVVQVKAAMQIIGSYHAQLYADANDLADLGFFAFPEISKAFKRDSLVAPITGYVIPKASAKNIANAKSFVAWLSSLDYAEAFSAAAPYTLMANSNVPNTDNAFVRQQTALVNASKYTVQSSLNETRPDFANTVVGPAFQAFLRNPADKKKIASNMAAQWRALPND